MREFKHTEAEIAQNANRRNSGNLTLRTAPIASSEQLDSELRSYYRYGNRKYG